MSETPIGSDVCACGDYRSQHGWGANAVCRVCGRMGLGRTTAAKRFRFCALRATDEELVHWRKHHAAKRTTKVRDHV